MLVVREGPAWPLEPAIALVDLLRFTGESPSAWVRRERDGPASADGKSLGGIVRYPELCYPLFAGYIMYCGYKMRGRDESCIGVLSM